MELKSQFCGSNRKVPANLQLKVGSTNLQLTARQPSIEDWRAVTSCYTASLYYLQNFNGSLVKKCLALLHFENKLTVSPNIRRKRSHRLNKLRSWNRHLVLINLIWQRSFAPGRPGYIQKGLLNWWANSSRYYFQLLILHSIHERKKSPLMGTVWNENTTAAMQIFPTFYFSLDWKCSTYHLTFPFLIFVTAPCTMKAWNLYESFVAHEAILGYLRNSEISNSLIW